MRATRCGGIPVLAAMGLLVGAQRAAAQELDCIMLPREIVTVSAPVEGVVDRVFVDRGDVIEAGAVLAELESSMERSAVAIAEARARQDYGVKANEVRAAYGARRFDRIEGLFAQSMVPLKDRDEAMTLKILADYELVEATEQERLADLELERARAALELRTVKSPISGVIMERLRNPGEIAAKESPIAKLARLDPLRVEVFVPVSRVGSITPGQTAVVVPEVPLGEIQATVTVVDTVADAASGTFGVRLEIPNPDHRIPAGLKCKVRLGEDGAASLAAAAAP